VLVVVSVKGAGVKPGLTSSTAMPCQPWSTRASSSMTAREASGRSPKATRSNPEGPSRDRATRDRSGGSDGASLVVPPSIHCSGAHNQYRAYLQVRLLSFPFEPIRAALPGCLYTYSARFKPKVWTCSIIRACGLLKQRTIPRSYTTTRPRQST
jgi:hypothetical protein